MPFRILSLDGGGAWAIIQVQTLVAMYGENATGRQVLSDFDLVAANSGGSLVLGGLIEDLPLSEIRSYFDDDRKRRAVFSPTRSWGDAALRELTGFGPKYDANAKLPGIEALMPRYGNSPLAGITQGVRRNGGADVHVLIVGFNYDTNRAAFFRSAQAGVSQTWGNGAPSTITVAEAIHASTNAPLNYFDAPASFPEHPERYWDGGVTGCNNPILAAVVESLVLGQRATDLAALSIGTASVALPLAAPGAPQSIYELPRIESTVVADLQKLATSILDDPPDAATFIAYVVTGGDAGVPQPAVSRVVRLSPLVSPVRGNNGRWTAPAGMSPAQFQYLCNVPMDAVAHAEIAAISQYADLWLGDRVANQPIRMDGATLALEIGYPNFSSALRAWQVIR